MTRVEVAARYERCPRPSAPVYLPLNRTQHVGSAVNLGALLHNAVALDGYATALNATVRCYEAQAEGGAE